MVKFGDRMIDMQHAGWEAHYINYEELKLQIDNIEKCQTDEDLEAKSDEFLATLKQMLVGVDAFVTDQMSTLQANTDLTDAKSLHDTKAYLKVLCRYVGTNVIAATKIVKKHDKHVQPSLRKRVVVGNIIRGSKVFAELIAYSSTVQRGGVPSNKVTPSDSGAAPTEEEAEMRGLPDWLLSGATENDAASETAQSEEEPATWHYPSFFSTYLDDWRAVQAPELAELVSRSNSEAGDGSAARS